MPGDATESGADEVTALPIEATPQRSDDDPRADRREREAWGFAAGATVVTIAALIIGSNLPPRDAAGIGFRTVLLAGASGLGCGYMWWRHKAGALPLPVWRVLFLAGAVALSVLSIASILSGVALVDAASGPAILRILGFLLWWLVTSAMLLQKFALPLIVLMIPWTLIWRWRVNRRYLRREVDGTGDG